MIMNQQAGSNTKFTPGIFIEIDNLMGGRKLSLVCDDGITAIDNVDITKSTPIMIHPKLKPVEIGFTHDYLKAHNLDRHYANVITLITRRDLGSIYADSLLMIRILHAITTRSMKSELSDKEYAEIIVQCQEMQDELDDIHSCLLEYLKSYQEK